MKDLSRFIPTKVGLSEVLSGHAISRMTQRGIRPWQVEAVLEYGRYIFARGAQIVCVGRREVLAALKYGVDIRGCGGIQIVMCTSSGSIMTVYRNHDFRGTRARRRKGGGA